MHVWEASTAETGRSSQGHAHHWIKLGCIGQRKPRNNQPSTTSTTTTTTTTKSTNYPPPTPRNKEKQRRKTHDSGFNSVRPGPRLALEDMAATSPRANCVSYGFLRMKARVRAKLRRMRRQGKIVASPNVMNAVADGRVEGRLMGGRKGWASLTGSHGGDGKSRKGEDKKGEENSEGD